jgi:hypothetical protein
MFFETLTIAILIFILQQIADLKKKILSLSISIESLKKEV